MELSRDSRLVRWAYLTDTRPNQTSLCALFWRSVLVSPCVAVVCVVISPIIGIVLFWRKYLDKPYHAYRRRQAQRANEKWYRKYEARQNHPPDPSAFKVLWLGLVAVKQKFCPIITFY